jgi:hypothetical protein
MAGSTPGWAALQGAIGGEVVLPGSAADERVHAPFNARFDPVRPQAVVLCAAPEDVAETISFARRHRLETATRSRGHCFAGRSLSPGVVIDVTQADSVSVSDGVVTVGAGTRLGGLYQALRAHDVTVPAEADRPPVVVLFGVLLGSQSDAGGLLDPVVARVGAAPASTFVEHLTNWETLERWARLDNLTDRRVTGEARELDFSPWGGAYNRVPADATAFVHRDQLYWLKHAVVVDPAASAAAKQVAHRWANRSWASVHRWGVRAGVPQLRRPRPGRLGRRLLRRQPRPSAAGQGTLRPRERLPLPPVAARAVTAAPTPVGCEPP